MYKNPYAKPYALALKKGSSRMKRNLRSIQNYQTRLAVFRADRPEPKGEDRSPWVNVHGELFFIDRPANVGGLFSMVLIRTLTLGRYVEGVTKRTGV